MELTPDFLLQNPELVTPLSPWCVALDNLELAIVLLSQPWIAGDGLRRADLERQVVRLAGELPLGPVYFQRVKRAVARLEEIGAVRGLGEGRSQRFAATPQGFAAFILNLRVLRGDPTLDGAEFELKRALVAMCNLILERLAELPEEVPAPPEVEGFFAEAERISVLSHRVVTDDSVRDALDVLRLIAKQRERMDKMLQVARHKLALAEAEAGALRGLDFSHEIAALLADAPGTLAMVREMASGVLPRLSQRATVLRYEHYLRYLDDLARVHAGELKTVALDSVRAFLARRRA